MDEPDESGVSLLRAFREVFGSLRWFQLLVWVAAVALAPFAYLLFFALRISYQRRLISGGRDIKLFDLHEAWGDLATAMVVSFSGTFVVAGVAYVFYLIVLKPLGVPEDLDVFPYLTSSLMTLGVEIFTLVAIAPARTHPIRAMVSSRAYLRRFGVAAAFAIATSVLLIALRSASAPFMPEAAIDLFFSRPALLAVRPVLTFYGIASMSTLFMLISELLVAHLFAQFLASVTKARQRAAETSSA